MNSNLYFILSASCKLVRGYTRSVIIDYSRGDLYFITHEYLELIEKIDRQIIDSIISELEDEKTVNYFNEFVSFLTENEIGFLTENASLFPSISDSVNGDYVSLQDIIIEIDEMYFDRPNFIKLCKDLTELRCHDFQIRFLSTLNIDLLNEIIEVINTTNANYIEVHCTYDQSVTVGILHKLIEENTILNKVYVYDSSYSEIYSVINEIPNYHSVALGEVYFINYSFESGNCCGIINHDNLNFTSFYLHNKLKIKNGCLDKKITIDKLGNIKNCPSMRNVYGNIVDVSIKEVIKEKTFTKFWDINKDQISVCKICEFRYNCTDCRAFIEDSNDIYSKPSKCDYNPVTCEWEDKIYRN